MTLKFIGGISKKLGSVDRGLLEVSCQIEIAFDETYSNDADDIQRRVEKAYAVAIVRSDLARALGTCVDSRQPRRNDAKSE